MKIGVAQIKCRTDNPAANVSKITDFVEKAAARNCQAIVFPEMADTGYEATVIRRFASSWTDGPVKSIRGAARKHRVFVVCGLSELDAGRLYNTIAIVDPDGELLGKYRKTHLAAFSPLDEDRTFAPGNSLETFQIGDMKWGAMVCYDLRFPEVARSLALKGAEVVALSSAWPFPRLRHWETLVNARAIENQMFILASNQVGSNGNVTFCGASRIVDPFGTTLVAASEESETLITAEVQKDRLESVRNAMPVFQHRRPRIYTMQSRQNIRRRRRP